MDFYQVLEKRRTIRDFSNKEVTDEVLEKVLSAAFKAPTNDHLRQFEFIVVRGQENIARLISPVAENMLLTGNFLKNYITVNMNSGPAMVLPVIFSLTLRIRIPILSLMVNLPEALIRSISMPCFPCLTSALLIS